MSKRHPHRIEMSRKFRRSALSCAVAVGLSMSAASATAMERYGNRQLESNDHAVPARLDGCAGTRLDVAAIGCDGGQSVAREVYPLPATALEFPAGRVIAQVQPPYEDPGVIGDPDSWRTDEFEADWGMAAIGAQYAYARGLSGIGISIGQFDTGVDLTHSEFAGRNHISLHLVDAGCARDDRGTRLVFDDGLGGCMSTHGDEYSTDVSWVFPYEGDSYAYAQYGSHGTHVAGTMVASRDGEGMHGVAFGSQLITARFFSDIAYAWIQNEDGTYDNFAFASTPGGGNTEGVRQIYEQLRQHDARALNIEVQYATTPDTTVDDLRGHYEGDREYWDAIADGAIESGIINVVAAGNYTSIPNLYPGLPVFRPDAEQYYLAVGSLTLGDDGSYDISSYSNRCAYAMDWCVMAPGEAVFSSVIDQGTPYWGTMGGSGTADDPYWFEYDEGLDLTPVHGYADFSGTSMAAPHAIGALALLFERFPYLSGTQVRDVLLTTATDMGEPGVDEVYGWGMINLEKAIDGPGLLLVDTEVVMDQRGGGVQVWEGAAWDDWANDIGGAGHLTKAGPGWLRLSGDNTFAGATVRHGILEFTGDNALAGDITVLGSGDLRVGQGARLDGDSVAINGGAFTLAGASTTGDVTVDDGRLRVGPAASALLMADSLMANDSSVHSEGSIHLAGDAVLQDTSLLVAGDGSLSAAAVSLANGTADIQGSLEATRFRASRADLRVGGNVSIADDATIDGGRLEIRENGQFVAGEIDLQDVALSIAGRLNGGGPLQFADGDFRLVSTGSVELGGLDYGNGNVQLEGEFRSTGDVAFSDADVSVSGNLDADGSLTLVDSHLRVQNGAEAGMVRASGAFAVSNGQVLLEGGLEVLGSTSFNDADLVIAPTGTVGFAGLDFGGGALEVGGALVSSGDLAFQDAELTVFAADGNGTDAGRLEGGNLRFEDGKAIIAGEASVLDARFDNSELDVHANASVTMGDLQLFGTQAVVNGLISAGHTLVDAGSSLRGAGTLGSTTVEGLIAPGNSIGTLTIEGDYVQTAGSTLEAEVTPPDHADLVDVSGTATIEGGTIRAIAHPGHYLLGQSYSIISADAGLSGEFDAFEVETVSPFLAFELVYRPDGLLIDVLRGSSLAAVAGTYNQLAAATALDELPIDQGLLVPLTQLTPDTAMQAVDQLSGDAHASVQSVLIDGSRLVREAALGRAAKGNSVFTAQRGEDANTGAWVEINRQGGRIQADGNAARTRFSATAALIGIDHQFDSGWKVGALGGGGRTDFDMRERGASGDASTRHLGIYGAQAWGGFGLRAGYTHAWHDVDLERRIALSGFSDATVARYDADGWQTFLEGSYRFSSDAWEIEPYLQYAHVSVDADGFSEEGGPAALQGRSAEARIDLATAGVRFNVNLRGSGQQQTWLSLRGNLGYRHAGGDQLRNRELSWDGAEWFNVRSPAVTDEGVLMELGIAARSSANTMLEIGYSGVHSDQARDHGASARFSWQF